MGQLWDLWLSYCARQPYPPSERRFARDLGISPTAFGNWKKPLSQLPSRDNLASFSALINQPYERVLDAALHDAGYLPPPQTIPVGDRLAIVRGVESRRTASMIARMLSDLEVLQPARFTRGRVGSINLDPASADVMNRHDTTGTVAVIILARALIEQRRADGFDPVEGENELVGLANVLIHAAFGESDREVVAARAEELLPKVLARVSDQQASVALSVVPAEVDDAVAAYDGEVPTAGEQEESDTP